MYELKSKKTGLINVVDEETYNTLKSTDQLKKYTIEKQHKPVKVIPAEIVTKKKQTKSDSDNES
jgi:hypothetical protein